MGLLKGVRAEGEREVIAECMRRHISVVSQLLAARSSSEARLIWTAEREINKSI